MSKVIWFIDIVSDVYFKAFNESISGVILEFDESNLTFKLLLFSNFNDSTSVGGQTFSLPSNM